MSADVYTVKITDEHVHLGLRVGSKAKFAREGEASRPGDIVAVWRTNSKQPLLTRLSAEPAPKGVGERDVVMTEGARGLAAYYLSQLDRIDKLLEVVSDDPEVGTLRSAVELPPDTVQEIKSLGAIAALSGSEISSRIDELTSRLQWAPDQLETLANDPADSRDRKHCERLQAAAEALAAELEVSDGPTTRAALARSFYKLPRDERLASESQFIAALSELAQACAAELARPESDAPSLPLFLVHDVHEVFPELELSYQRGSEFVRLCDLVFGLFDRGSSRRSVEQYIARSERVRQVRAGRHLHKAK